MPLHRRRRPQVAVLTRPHRDQLTSSVNILMPLHIPRMVDNLISSHASRAVPVTTGYT